MNLEMERVEVIIPNAWALAQEKPGGNYYLAEEAIAFFDPDILDRSRQQGHELQLKEILLMRMRLRKESSPHVELAVIDKLVPLMLSRVRYIEPALGETFVKLPKSERLANLSFTFAGFYATGLLWPQETITLKLLLE